MNARDEALPGVARNVGLLASAMALTIATGWFVVHGLIVVASSRAIDSPIAEVIDATPSYLILATLLLARLVCTIVALIKAVRRDVS
ncbi:hypothetical protein WT72_32030 [Burkholderia pseudomultivorans]|uniref:hypothetical protein n=1 Tax=Burkholderia pseudomultivorans TaxID=1207504 RepID=UPI0007522EA5|nr:hypothetical protein [Burkholderia pseudomultivorans]KWI47530.1 hypothetical protein WT72_32030 [Burkholderia pseudomultivorans]